MGTCTSCGRRPAAAMLQRHRAIAGRGEVSPGRKIGEHPLCSACITWLRELLVAARHGSPYHGIIAAPRPTASQQAFRDQCHVCFTIAGSGAVLASLETRAGFAPGWPALVLCPSCDTWLAAMASDGRSARGMASREVDGAYGRWLHPNLRDLSIALDVQDAGARRAILQAARAMDVRVVSRPAFPGDRVARFFELPFAEPDAVEAGAWRADIALVPFAHFAHLADALEDGATDWLTLPFTPQQAAAALLRALRHGESPPVFDSDVLLPVAAALDPHQHVLAVQPAQGQDRAELAWLLRRHCRGYDDVVLSPAGNIIVIPRAPESQFQLIASRIGGLLEGRCRITPRRAPSLRHRLDRVG
ncbi:MAG: hypothetical protein U5Q44_14380 [Dehalococcoidia bacterium]|nr:hypothetical protein [Dehalococcoidia bacterium]